ncbi:MAG TPA: hypothetical protein VNA25_25505 [Phycisphaerae bacterium]|nr:hypothetical protein [Phycisphaerae bacterium]
MRKKPPRSAPEVITSIKDNAARVRDAADGMTKRIEQFQVYLGSLRGRVDTTHFGSHPDYGPQDEVDLALRLHRKEKAWVLSWGSYHPIYNDENPMDWQPLTEAPLRIKIAAVGMFPDLLEAIEKTQIRLAEEIEEVTAEFDAFAESLNKGGKERA